MTRLGIRRAPLKSLNRKLAAKLTIKLSSIAYCQRSDVEYEARLDTQYRHSQTMPMQIR